MRSGAGQQPAAGCCHVGCRYGELGEILFQFLHDDPFTKHWYCDEEGNKLCASLKKSNPFMDGFRNWGLHAPKEASIPSEACSLGEAAMTLIADERIRQLLITRRFLRSR